MSERAELICRMMVDLGAEFERLAEATTHQQRPELLDAEAIGDIAAHAREASLIAEAAFALAKRGAFILGIERT